MIDDKKRNFIIEKMKQEKGNLDNNDIIIANSLSELEYRDISIWLEPEYGEWFIHIFYKNSIMLEIITDMSFENRNYMWSVYRGYEKTGEEGRSPYYGEFYIAGGDKKAEEFIKFWKSKVEPIYL